MRSSFVLYTKIEEVIKALDDSQTAALFRAIISYEKTGEVPEISDPVVNVAFIPVRQDLDITNERWDIERDRRSEAAKKANNVRWNKGKSDNVRTDPNGSKQTKSDKNGDNRSQSDDNLADNVYVYVNDNVNNNINTHGECADNSETLFTELWSLYPRKMGKGSVSKSTKQKLLKIGREKMISAIERFKADMERQNRPLDKYPYGSTFFNSGYLDYLDGTEEKKTPPEQPEVEYVDWSNPYVYRDRIAEGYTVENGRWIPPVRVQ